jgi:hypothetical protein
MLLAFLGIHIVEGRLDIERDLHLVICCNEGPVRRCNPMVVARHRWITASWPS